MGATARAEPGRGLLKRARSATYGLTTGIARERGGAYGLGLIYAGAAMPGHTEAGVAA